MEYTKDLILNVRYDEVNNILNVKNPNFFKRVINKIKKNKIISISLITALIFITIDSILLLNFINILSKI